MTHTAYRARWIVPPDGPPVADGTLLVDGGTIADVTPRDVPGAIDLGRVALLPAFVNAHAHLEFADLPRPLEPPLPFTAWIRSVIAARRARSVPTGELVRRGRRESLAAGTACVADIRTDDVIDDDESLGDADRDPAPRTIDFREIIGLLPEQFDERLDLAQRHLAGGARPVLPVPRDAGATHDPTAPDAPRERRSIRGLSPHAPYSVHPDLLARLVELARAHDAPLAMHVAETAAELELLAHGTGEFARMLTDFGLWRPGLLPTGRTPRDVLEILAEAPRALVVHGTHLAADELDFVAARPGLVLVCCPRTHAFFRQPPHPWRDLLARGGHVAFGTDSRASNPDLEPWREVQFLHAQDPSLDPRLLIDIATGRRAGWLAEIACGARRGDVGGERAWIGGPADLAVLGLGGTDDGDAYRACLHPATCAAGTILGGRFVPRAAQETPTPCAAPSEPRTE